MKTLMGKIRMHLRVFLLATLTIGLFDLPGTSGCSGRQVLNETSGEITDGNGDYPASAHCEWLIVGGPNKFITLEFSQMDTECSYDYLFVYDGLSYNDPMLGSFSGNTLPDRVLATSGHMLIYFFSDRNYVLKGFKATYQVNECPHNCTENGHCDLSNHRCLCENGFKGSACDNPVCPNNCGDHGTCDLGSQACLCDKWFAGYSCSLSMKTREGQSQWHLVSPTGSGFAARSGHAGAFMTSTKRFYLYGGRAFSNFLSDVVYFDFNQNIWVTVTRSLPWPTARHGHAISAHRDVMYMYGGQLENGKKSRELWKFDPSLEEWTLLPNLGGVYPIGVSYHTLTLVEDRWLYLFGGRTETGEFSSEMYRYDLTGSNAWEEVVPRGGKVADRRLIGHSTVYHTESKSLLVFGGFSPDYARFPRRTAFLHSYHIEENYWSQIHYEVVMGDQNWPKDRAYHSAVILGNYMIVYGGNYHEHHKEEICYDNKIYFYHLGCHRWVNVETLAEAFPGDDQESYEDMERRTFGGRFAHVAVGAFGNTVLIAGGYKGSVLGDLIAYTVPLAIAKNKNDIEYVLHWDHCPEYAEYRHCKEDPECIWCMAKPSNSQPGCMHRSQSQLCLRDYRPGSCPGICSALNDCKSCVVQGQGAVHPPSSFKVAGGTAGSNAGLWKNEKCAWCVKEATCQRLSEPSGWCNPQEGMLEGWWGTNSSRPTTLPQCRTDDFPAGLHWITYSYPPNVTQPDEVHIVRESSKNFQFKHLFDSENSQAGKYTARFQGFLHPLGATSSNGPPLKLYLVSVTADAWLYLSTDEQPQHKELVAKLIISPYQMSVAKRGNDDVSIFPEENRGHKYYVEQISEQPISDQTHTQVASTMMLEWTGALKDPNRIRQSFTEEFLEPYNNGACSKYSNCMACMTDTQCGWCMTSNACVNKLAAGLTKELCGTQPGANYLVTVPSHCPLCVDHITCEDCAKDQLCEWLTHEARCVRRGRFNESVRNAVQCPSPCLVRTNCSWCLSERNECAWCEATETCFPFVDYMMRYAYGGCMQWVDNMSEQKCPDCSLHTNCKSCLNDFQCGWCGNSDNPTIGRCLQGDFTGPSIGGSCGALISAVHNVSESDPSAWSYGQCPDVEECRLGLHDCHVDATCHNTPTSFTCTCNRGFTGNGKDSCDRTCYYDCVHGNCSGSPQFTCMCDVGWTGLECNTNCGCYNHSTCVNGLGICDECQHWTMGAQCQLCRPGSFGDATTEIGCQECQCNGHGQKSLGYCNSTTGKCFCKDNTMGAQCEKCMPGYYGDPRNGGRCFLRCEGRTILGNISEGALGSHAGAGVNNKGHVYCLWILTVHEDLNNLRLFNVVPTITFTMLTDIKTLCSRDYVYVYDGIPRFMTGSSTEAASLLAAYCGYSFKQPMEVEAKSGYLTVYFEGNIEPSETATQGFNATYKVNACPKSCTGHRTCKEGMCGCSDNYSGIDCELEQCPMNCSYSMGQGVCSQRDGMCLCAQGYGGRGCNQVVTAKKVVYRPVYDPWRSKGIEAFNSTLARSGHTLVSCNGIEIYMFGGYSLSRGYLNDLLKFNASTKYWTPVLPTSEDQPSPRQLHAAECVPALRAMYVYGGMVEGTGAVREMWKFSLDTHRWSQLEIKNPDEEWPVPAMAGHTMTRVDDVRLWFIGGYSAESYFSDTMYEFEASTNTWRELSVSGAHPTGLYGHSSVFHRASHSIYVYGGFEYQTDRTVISHNLYSVSVSIDGKLKMWSQLPPEVSNRPTERFFHAAVTTDEYMLVFGGRTSQEDFDNSVLAYRYTCNHWFTLSPGEHNVIGDGIPYVIGAAAVVAANISTNFRDIFIVGGFNSMSQGTITHLRLPKDLCTLLTTKESCLATLGCAACIDEDHNVTYCYTNQDVPRFDCARGSSWSYDPGQVCDVDRIQTRECNQHKTCAECLAQWPVHKDHDRVCQWCSNCPTGKCIPKNSDCTKANDCKRDQRVIVEQDDCVERLCQASSCESCWKKKKCIWTRQFQRSSEVGRTLSLEPIYDWNCVVKSLLEATQYPIWSSPPDECPAKCSSLSNCRDCLKSVGGEGGSQRCVWSEHLQECMPPAYLQLRCPNGECGHILQGQPSHCPQKCSLQTQCQRCLTVPGCGWCSLSGSNGQGLCMRGGLMGPLDGQCVAGNVSYNNDPDALKRFDHMILNEDAPLFSFGSCPPENECLNGHHNCDESENCQDLPSGFICKCKDGYVRDGGGKGKCRPDCRQRCEPHGDCVAPNVCKCHFGYVGDDCSTECECNKHSNCESVEKKDVCLQCMNNTKGQQCQVCKPLFVGNPVEGGSCTSCNEFCHERTGICVSDLDLPFLLEMLDSRASLLIHHHHPPKDYLRAAVTALSRSGALNATDFSYLIRRAPKDNEAVCLNCAGNTQGDRCEECQDGFFRIATSKVHPCRPCECNGHSNTCTKDDGRNCDCRNNTKSPKCDDSKAPCFTQQCTECIESFLGVPTEGHQCYRQMTVDRDYCFDPETQMNCNKPSGLLWGRTVFFVVQPKYLNVNIRITLDVSIGGVDVYFSPMPDTFIVTVDPKTGVHRVEIDPKYYYNHRFVMPHEREARSTESRSWLKTVKRAVPTSSFVPTPVPARNSSMEPDSPDITKKLYTLEQRVATDFNTFITVMDPDTFLIVKGVKDRLVITLPNDAHKLKISRFYLVLHGTGSGQVNETYGNLFFRQDQPHIDLFVFFSVFFSCFFKFLAICVLLWKLKQSYDARQSRHRRQMEMKHMASRPFASAALIMAAEMELPKSDVTSPLLDSDSEAPVASAGAGATPLPVVTSPVTSAGVCATPTPVIPKRSSKYSITSSENLSRPQSPPFWNSHNNSSYTVHPLAIEPTDDGIASINTVFVQLPGGPMAPVRACLGSSLVQTSRQYTLSTSIQHPHNPPKQMPPCSQNGTVFILSRPSSSA